MTFSSDKPFNNKSLKNAIDIVLRKYGPKVKYYSKHDYKPVTGTIVTPSHELYVPNALQKRIYDDFQSVKNIENSTITVEQSAQINALKGRILAAQRIQPNKFPQIFNIIRRIKVSSIDHKESKQRQHQNYRNRRTKLHG